MSVKVGNYKVYVFSINKKHEMIIRTGRISIKTMSSTGIFFPDDKSKNLIFCSKEEGVLHNGVIWYRQHDRGSSISDKKRYEVIKTDAMTKFLNNINNDIKSTSSKLVQLTALKNDLLDNISIINV